MTILSLQQKVKKYWTVALFGEVFAVILYFMMMSQQLTNTFDGLWHQNYHHAGNVELRSGRWMLYFIDKLNMGLHADPVASIATLSLFILGFLLVLDLFGVENKFAGCLCLALFLSSTAVSNTLSYRMTSLGYGFAYLFAAFGIYSANKIKSKIAAMLISGISLGLSMACYQAYLGVYCVIAVFYVIFLCSASEAKDADGKSLIFSSILRVIGSMLIGALFYVGSLHFFLRLNQVSLSNYNGVGGITLTGLIAGIPENMFKTYRYFGVYYLTDTLKINRLQHFGGLYILLALLIALILVIGVRTWKANKIRMVVLLAAALAIPVACNAYMLIAGDKLELQMTSGLAMLMPLTMIIAFSCFQKQDVLRIACAFLCTALLYGNSMQVLFDQEAMYEGRNACKTMATQVLTDLKDQNLLSGDYEYFFVGVPARNPFFSVSEIYTCANGYAQMGNFWVSGNCCQMSYHGLISKWMGFNLPMSGLYYETFAENSMVMEMPSFPNRGYITLTDDNVVIIKISEYEKYREYSLY